MTWAESVGTEVLCNNMDSSHGQTWCQQHSAASMCEGYISTGEQSVNLSEDYRVATCVKCPLETPPSRCHLHLGSPRDRGKARTDESLGV